MTSLIRRITIVFIFAVLLFGFNPTAHAVEDAIIAVVNDELITLRDLKDYAHSTYARLVTEGFSEAEIEPIMKDLEEDGINKLIEDRLILSKANELKLEVREDLVDERIQELEERYGSEQNLIDALIMTGATLTDLKNKIRDEMKIKYVVDHEVRSKIYVNPQEVTEYYKKHKDLFGRKERVNLESIFIPFNNDKAAAQAKAKEALTQITEGKDFKEVSKEYSKAPSVGIVERGQLLPLVEDTVFNLEINEVSSPIETDNGIYIFKLIGKTPAEIPNLEDVKEQVHDILFREKFKKRFLGWLEKLKSKAYIEIK